MMTSYLLMTVLVMAVMTYLPRMLPLTFFKKKFILALSAHFYIMFPMLYYRL